MTESRDEIKNLLSLLFQGQRAGFQLRTQQRLLFKIIVQAAAELDDLAVFEL